MRDPEALFHLPPPSENPRPHYLIGPYRGADVPEETGAVGGPPKTREQENVCILVTFSDVEFCIISFRNDEETQSRAVNVTQVWGVKPKATSQ